MKNSFPALEQALGGYLHQDFLCDYPNADAAVADFVSSATADELKSVRDELVGFIQIVQSADNPGRLLLEIGCYYDPSADGRSVEEWLRTVESKLLSS